MKQLRFLTIVLLLISASTIFAQEDLKAHFQALGDQMAKDMMANNHEAVLDLYTQDGISMPMYAPMIRGREEAEAMHEAQQSMGMEIKNFEADIVDVWADGKYAYEIGTYKITMTFPGMPQPVEDKGKYLNVWEKVDGEWKIKADIWNTDLNPMQNMPQGGGEY